MSAHDEFLPLFLAHQGDLRAFIGALIRDAQTREDIFQNVALTLWESFDRYDRERSFGAWARGIAAKKVLHEHRSNARFPLIFPVEAIQTILDAYNRTEAPEAPRRTALRECMDRLPERTKEILTLRYDHDLSGDSIAVRLGSTVDAVHQTLSRTRASLADCIRRRLALSVVEILTDSLTAMNATIAALIEKHLNAALTAAEAATLAQAMAESPALAEEFAAVTRMEADLSAATKERERTGLYTRRMERAAAESKPARVRRPWPVKTMTAAAGLAVVIGVGWRLMESEPGTKTTAKKGSPASPRTVTGDSVASFSSDQRPADASVMKRKLRRFVSTTSSLRSVSVSQALAALQTEWKGCAHQDPKDRDAIFALADAARQLWKQPEDEPVVSLEIPGISLLTSLELIAAQAGLKTTVTAAGVSMEPFPRKDDGKQRTWSIPLSLASVSTFMSRASRQRQESQTWGRHVESFYFKLANSSNRTHPSWLEMPAQVISPNWTYFSDSPSGQTVDGRISTWTDSGLAVTADYLLGDIPVADGSDVALRNPEMVPEADSGEFLTELDTQFQGTTEAILGSSATPVTWDANTLHEVHWGEQLIAGDTIDLNFTPELVEYEGFINYGEPIQTTGINALGQSEPVILTDSGITQPVFATRAIMDYPGNLTRLLVAHGIPAEGATWDQEHGVVVARGPLSQLRAAQAAATAVEEAATSGVTVEMKVIEWKNGVPTPVLDLSGLLPPPVAGPSYTLTAETAAKVLGDPDVERVEETKATQHPGMPLTLTGTKGHGDNMETVAVADVSGITGSGFSWRLPVKIRRSPIAGPKTDDGLTSSVRESSEHQADLQLQDGEWLRVDFPAKGDNKALTVLLSVQPATVQPQ